MGRPKLKSGRRSKMVKLRMSAEEHRVLEKKAKAAGLTVSKFLRKCAED